MSDLYDDLDEFLSGEDDTEVPAGADDADRLLRKVARIERELADVADLFQTEAERLADWRDRRTATLTASRQAVVARLELYLRALQENDRKLASVDLPNGRIVSRKQQPQWDIGEEFIEWANKARPDLLRWSLPKASPDVREIKAALTHREGQAITADGEVVPGVTVVERDRKYDVEVSR